MCKEIWGGGVFIFVLCFLGKFSSNIFIYYKTYYEALHILFNITRLFDVFMARDERCQTVQI
jgi:hypothetical protein